MFVAPDGKVFGFLPTLNSADFPAEIGGNLFPGDEFLFGKGRPFGTWLGSARRYVGGRHQSDSVRGLYPRNCAGIVKTVSTSGLGGNSAGGGADEEPFGGAADASPSGATFGDAHGVVAFVGKCGGLFALVGEVVLRGSELGLAGFAVDGEVVERL